MPIYGVIRWYRSYPSYMFIRGKANAKKLAKKLEEKTTNEITIVGPVAHYDSIWTLEEALSAIK